MRILRKGGEFTDSRLRRYGIRVIVVLIFGTLLLVASRYLQSAHFNFLALALFFVLFKAAYNRWESWFIGKRGELAVTEVLKSLPDDYVLLNDLTLPDRRGNIDHLLIGPNGLFVIETKNYSGNVKCIGDQWFVNGRRIKSLSQQAKRNAMAVHKNLTRVFSERREKLPFIPALLVFVKHRSQLNLNQPTLPVLKAEQLVEFIRRYSSTNAVTPETTRAIVHRLQSFQGDTTEREHRVEKVAIVSRQNDTTAAVKTPAGRFDRLRILKS